MLWLALLTLCPAAAAAGADDHEFPAELVDFGPASTQPLLAGTGTDTWDRRMRERGWILREGNTWHLWYCGYNEDRSSAKFLGYATSCDGLRWTRSPCNPLDKEDWVEDMCVVRHGDVYYMFAEGRDDIAQLLTSSDRLHWKEQGVLDIRQSNGEPISAGPRGTPVAWVVNEKWYLLYERDDAAVWLASSADLHTWTNVQDAPVIQRGPEPYDQCAVAVDQVVAHQGRYYAYYHASALPDWAEWTTCLAVSEDLLHWKKYPANPVLPVASSDPERSSGIVVHDGTSYRLYTMHPDVRVHWATPAPPSNQAQGPP